MGRNLYRTRLLKIEDRKGGRQQKAGHAERHREGRRIAQWTQSQVKFLIPQTKNLFKTKKGSLRLQILQSSSQKQLSFSAGEDDQHQKTL